MQWDFQLCHFSSDHIILIICFFHSYWTSWASKVVQCKESACQGVRGIRDVGSIPGSEGSPGEGNGNPFQYSYLENSMDKGAWRAIVHGVTKSQTQLSNCTCTQTYLSKNKFKFYFSLLFHNICRLQLHLSPYPVQHYASGVLVWSLDWTLSSLHKFMP